MDVGRVKFYARADAWAAWQALNLPDDTLEVAFTELKDERLVAAYLLETICSDARVKAVENVGQQVKRFKDGAEEMEYFQAESSLSLQADGWCHRATTLRAQVGRELQATVRRSSSMAYQPELES